MWINKALAPVAVWLLMACALLAPAPSHAVEDVSMGTALSVEGGHVVVRWSTKGFDHYNVRWSANGGAAQQVERAGDKDFRYLDAFRPGVVYSVSVQGCEKNFLAHSHCTRWEEAHCGTARQPCDGDAPRPLVSGGSLCLDVDAPHQHDNGARVQLWACNGSDQQLWTIRGGNIRSLAGKCLDVNVSELTNNGGHVQVWDCNGSRQQHWMPRGLELLSGGGKCLDANLPQLHANGGVVQVWDCNKQVQQQWRQPGTY